MYLVLVWGPEFAGSAQQDDPFGGISLGFVSLSRESCESWIEVELEEYPNRIYCLMPMKSGASGTPQ